MCLEESENINRLQDLRKEYPFPWLDEESSDEDEEDSDDDEASSDEEEAEGGLLYFV